MKNCLTPVMVRAELKRMPDTLDHMYDRILQVIPRLHQQYPHGSNGSISMTIAVMSMEQGSIVTSPIEKSAD
jgi:hypothetical protein